MINFVLRTVPVKVSVITAAYNSAATLGDALESVARQADVDMEHIVVDALSTDDTPQIVDRFDASVATYIREADRGIYDAFNKGIAAATGDVIGFLNADDVLASSKALSRIADCFENGAQASYGDLVYVSTNDPERVTRIWKSGHFGRKRFYYGWMPPHPTVYIRRDLYERLGGYNLEMKTAADYELLVRYFVKHEINAAYIPETIVKMRVGGASNASLGNRLNANKDDREAWVVNGLRPPLGLRFTKPLRKVPQFLVGLLGRAT